MNRQNPKKPSDAMAKDHSKEHETPEAGVIPAFGFVAQEETSDSVAKNEITKEERETDAPPSAPRTVLAEIPVVILGSAEALPLLTKVWEQKAIGTRIIPVEIGDSPFSEIIDQVIANDDIPDSFVLVPANCFPTHRVTIADLTIYRVRRMKAKENSDKWETTPCTGLPFLVETTALLQALEGLGDTYTEEEFLKAYNAIAHPGELPEEIGMAFGNTVSYAIQRPKCMATVAEALVRKRFICANGEGFAAIKDRLALLVKDE